MADVSFISLSKVLPAVVAAAAPRFDLLAMVKPQFEVGRERVGKGGVVRSADDRRSALLAVAEHARDELGAAVLGYASSGLPGPAGNEETLRLARRGRPRGRAGGPRGRRAKGGAVSRPPRSLTVFTHASPEQTGDALRRVIELAREAGVEVRVPPGELEKHDVEPLEGVSSAPTPVATPTSRWSWAATARSSRRSACSPGAGSRSLPSTSARSAFSRPSSRPSSTAGMRMALGGDLDVLELPGLVARTSDGDALAMNDVSFSRSHSGRVAELAYSVEGEELGEVRCDGLVVATPAGSTGYNLANGGPVLAWGVEGYVVSFIAPHTLTARSLVVAPGDMLTVTNRSREEGVEMTTDGRSVCDLPREASCRSGSSTPRAAGPGAGCHFYHRLREKFGRLAVLHERMT